MADVRLEQDAERLRRGQARDSENPEDVPTGYAILDISTGATVEEEHDRPFHEIVPPGQLPHLR